MKLFILIAIVIILIDLIFYAASKRRPIFADLLDSVPTPHRSGNCSSCDLAPYCEPRMLCWEAYREAVKETINQYE